MVLSQEPLAITLPVGEKAKELMGPSWPANTSSNLPVCTDHRKISNESVEPAATTSPLGSTAKHENWTGEGDVNVLKLR